MFTVAAEAYDRYMGRYSIPLAPGFCEFSQIAAGQRVLDVGCGPGALTAELVKRLGPAGVSAVEPSEPFVEAARERHPGVDVRQAAAEQLPFPDGDFDASLAQLVVHFMASPIEGLSEMARVTRPGGVVAACVWDHAGGEGPLSRFWEACPGARPGGRGRVRTGRLSKRPPRRTPPGSGAAGGRGDSALSERRARDLRRMVGALHLWRGHCRRVPVAARSRATDPSARALPGCLPGRGPVLTARAWAARGRA